MKSTSKNQAGAVESCATPEHDQALSARCGRLSTIEAQGEFSAPPAPSPPNDIQSTIVGLREQDCPGGGWNGMPPEIERATVSDCLAHGVCGCIYGDAVQHLEAMRTALRRERKQVFGKIEAGQ